MINLAGSNINQSLNTLENFVGKFNLWRGLFRKHLDYDNDSVSVYLVKNNPELAVTSLFKKFNGERKTNYDNVNELSAVVENDCFNVYVIGKNIKSLTNLQPKLKHTPIHYNDMATIYNNYVKKLNDLVNESTHSIIYTSAGNVKHTVSIDKLIEQLNVLILADECNGYGREILTRYKTDLTKFLPRGFYDNSTILPINVFDDYDSDDDSSTKVSSIKTISTYSHSSSSSSESSVDNKAVRKSYPKNYNKKLKVKVEKNDLDKNSSSEEGNSMTNNYSGQNSSSEDDSSATENKVQDSSSDDDNLKTDYKKLQINSELISTRNLVKDSSDEENVTLAINDESNKLQIHKIRITPEIINFDKKEHHKKRSKEDNTVEKNMTLKEYNAKFEKFAQKLSKSKSTDNSMEIDSSDDEKPRVKVSYEVNPNRSEGDEDTDDEKKKKGEERQIETKKRGRIKQDEDKSSLEGSDTEESDVKRKKDDDSSNDATEEEKGESATEEEKIKKGKSHKKSSNESKSSEESSDEKDSKSEASSKSSSSTEEEENSDEES